MPDDDSQEVCVRFKRTDLPGEPTTGCRKMTVATAMTLPLCKECGMPTILMIVTEEELAGMYKGWPS